MLCQGRTAVAVCPGHAIATTIFCRSWGCPECAERRSAQLIALAISGQPTRFITLTSKRRPGLTPEAAAKQQVHGWQVSVKRWKRLRPGNDCDYMPVFEATKNGWPHLHILWRGPWIDQKWLSSQMDELTGSPVVWVEKIDDSKKAARYIAKYCGKEPHRFGTCKRYWSTQGYNLTPLDPENEAFWSEQRYELSDDPLKYHVEQWHIGLKPDIRVGDGIAWWGAVPSRRQGARSWQTHASQGEGDHAGKARDASIPRPRGRDVKPAAPAAPLRFAPTGDFPGGRHQYSGQAP